MSSLVSGSNAATPRVLGEDFEEIAIAGIPLMANTTPDSLPSPDSLILFNDWKNRVLDLCSEVDQETVLGITKLILAYNKEDLGLPESERKPIRLIIFSPGGDIDAMFHLIDVITLSKTPVYTINIGSAYSAGFDILLAGHKRFCLPRSTCLVHSGSAQFSGTSEQVQSHSKHYSKVLKQCEEWELSRTKIPKELYGKRKKTEWFLDAKEQVDFGVVDKIVSSLDEIL